MLPVWFIMQYVNTFKYSAKSGVKRGCLLDLSLRVKDWFTSCKTCYRLCNLVLPLLLQLGHGDFSAANTKVLRMVNTLTVDNEAKQTIEALRTELQKTKEKLQAVEELKSQSGQYTVLFMTNLH